MTLPTLPQAAAIFAALYLIAMIGDRAMAFLRKSA
jgi:hypothetical protein